LAYLDLGTKPQVLARRLPQVEALRLEIRRREWVEAAQRCVATKCAPAALQEVLAEAACMRPEADDLEAKIRWGAPQTGPRRASRWQAGRQADRLTDGQTDR
jgi:hypothetical protein